MRRIVSAKYDFDIHCRNSKGSTFLHTYCNTRDCYGVEVKKSLFDIAKDYGFDFDTTDDCGMTVLHKAASQYHYEAVQALLAGNQKYGLNLNQKDGSDGDTFLHICIQRNHYKDKVIYEIIKTSHQLGFDFNATNNLGETILHDAVTKGPYDLVESILKDAKELNLNVNIRNHSGHTAKDYLEESQHWHYKEKREGEKKKKELLKLYDEVAKDFNRPIELSRAEMLAAIKEHQEKSYQLTEDSSYQTVQMIYEHSRAFFAIIENLTKNATRNEEPDQNRGSSKRHKYPFLH